MKKIPVSVFLIYVLSVAVFSINFSELRGLVIDSETLEPVTGVKIKINTEEKFTDHKGIFFIDSLISGDNLIILEHPKYENINQVVHLYKGLNTRKFFIKKLFNEKLSNKVVTIKKEPEIKTLPQKTTTTKNYWSQLFIEPNEPEFPNVCEEIIETNKIVKQDDDFFNRIRKIITRLEGKMYLKAKVIDSKTKQPLINIPVQVENELKFTDKHGFIEYYADDNKINININQSGVEPYTQILKLTDSKNYVEILCDKISEDKQ